MIILTPFDFHAWIVEAISEAWYRPFVIFLDMGQLADDVL